MVAVVLLDASVSALQWSLDAALYGASPKHKGLVRSRMTASMAVRVKQAHTSCKPMSIQAQLNAKWRVTYCDDGKPEADEGNTL